MYHYCVSNILQCIKTVKKFDGIKNFFSNYVFEENIM